MQESPIWSEPPEVAKFRLGESVSRPVYIVMPSLYGKTTLSKNVNAAVGKEVILDIDKTAKHDSYQREALLLALLNHEWDRYNSYTYQDSVRIITECQPDIVLCHGKPSSMLSLNEDDVDKRTYYADLMPIDVLEKRSVARAAKEGLSADVFGNMFTIAKSNHTAHASLLRTVDKLQIIPYDNILHFVNWLLKFKGYKSLPILGLNLDV